MEGGQDIAPQKHSSLSLQEKALAYGMLHSESNSVTNYKIDQQGIRLHTINFSDQDFKTLVDNFKDNPKNYLATARENLLSIMKDTQLSHTERINRLNRYLDSYFELQLKLDHQAFLPSEKILKGIPDYIPDGLSDMGSDPSVEPDLRTREKLRVNKEQIFKQSKDLFISIFSYDFSAIPPQERNERIKTFIAKKVSLYIYKTLSYDYKNIASPYDNKSVPLSDYGDKNLAVCRQQALYTQVLLQAFGLTSKLVKSDVSFNNKNYGPHVNNLVRINGKWSVLDVTNPEQISQQQSAVFMKPIKETDINLNKNTYKWSFANAYGTRDYATRNNMYYRIRNNTKDSFK